MSSYITTIAGLAILAVWAFCVGILLCSGERIEDVNKVDH